MTTFNIKITAIAAMVSLGLATEASHAQIQKPTMEQWAQPSMSYSFALTGKQNIKTEAQVVETQSDEYWKTITAQQLKQGVDIHTSVAGALIKISRDGSQTRPLNADQIKLYSPQNKNINLTGKIIGEQDLKATGIFENATAIKMDKAIHPGKFQLRYDGPLAKDGKFVIHVKEKHSPNKLTLSTPKQHIIKGQTLNFKATMQQNDKTLPLTSVDAYLMSPSGKKFAVDTQKISADHANIMASELINNLNQIEAPINGLYELHINTVANDNGMEILRTGKMAFALAEQTAVLAKQPNKPINALRPQAKLPLIVSEPGRYEVRAILYGYDANGQLKPIMETHAAKNLETGKAFINMEFDRKILIKSDLSAPYMLKHVRLYDQTRMSRL